MGVFDDVDPSGQSPRKTLNISMSCIKCNQPGCTLYFSSKEKVYDVECQHCDAKFSIRLDLPFGIADIR